MSSRWKPLGLGICLIGLTSCATYQAKPLDTDIHFTQINELKQESVAAEFTNIWPLTSREHIFDPTDGLDMDELAMLAVANNPQLKVARDQAGEAHAQAFSAGLLPDPQINLSQDFPVHEPQATTAYGAGIGLDITGLILHSATREAAQQSASSADLDLLWQEWQIANQARLLFVRTIALERQSFILANLVSVLEIRYEHSKRALDAGNLTLDVTSADLAALHAAKQKLNEVQRQLLTTHFDINALVGLDPETKLNLTGMPDIPDLDESQIETELANLSHRRPDLQALQHGYSAQEAKLRVAILSQFQPIGLAFNLARDTSAILTGGYALNLALPIFNRNQGGIAIEKATRQRLYDEFNQRLKAAYSEVHQLLADGHLLQVQLSDAQSGLTDARNVAEKSADAFSAHNMDELSYVQALGTATDKRIQVIVLRETLMEQQIALQILLGGDLPASKVN
jgi:outer membrane protein TolC